MSTIGWSGPGRTVERISKWAICGSPGRSAKGGRHPRRCGAMTRSGRRPGADGPIAGVHGTRLRQDLRLEFAAAGSIFVDMDTPTRLPALFLSHGSPMLAIEASAAGRFLDGLGDGLPRPRAIVVASAHFTADRPTLGGHPQPHTVHDFGGVSRPR